MKLKSKKFLNLAALLTGALMFYSAASPAASTTPKFTNGSKPINISIVNFKACVEESKYGKQEQANFEVMKKQMEGSLEEREKTLNDMAAKFNDPDYLDSLSPDAETELKRKFRSMNQELTQLQNQYFQTLNQLNFKVIQKLTEIVSKASKQVANTLHIDLILNEEGGFFYAPELDISKLVVEEMDKMFENEAKESKTAA